LKIKNYIYDEGGYYIGKEVCFSKDGYKLFLISLTKFNQLYADNWRSKTV